MRQRENLGAVPNFNRVFQLAQGGLFKWAAFDDICAPTFLERCVEILDADQEVAWCHSRSAHIDPKGRELEDLDRRDVSYADPSCDIPGSTRESRHVHDRFRAVVLGDGGCLDSYVEAPRSPEAAGLVDRHVLQQDEVRRSPFVELAVGAASLCARRPRGDGGGNDDDDQPSGASPADSGSPSRCGRTPQVHPRESEPRRPRASRRAGRGGWRR